MLIFLFCFLRVRVWFLGLNVGDSRAGCHQLCHRPISVYLQQSTNLLVRWHVSDCSSSLVQLSSTNGPYTSYCRVFFTQTAVPRHDFSSSVSDWSRSSLIDLLGCLCQTSGSSTSPSKRSCHPLVTEYGTHPSSTIQISSLQKREIEKLVHKMLRDGVIKPSTSLFSSSVLLVRKKDRTWFCVDYRALNAVTVKDRFSILSIHELFEELYVPDFIPNWICWRVIIILG